MAQVGYFEAFGYIWKGYWTEWKQRDLKTEIFLKDFIDDFFTYSFISTNDILLCLFLGFLFTIVRFFLTRAVFKVGGECVIQRVLLLILYDLFIKKNSFYQYSVTSTALHDANGQVQL